MTTPQKKARPTRRGDLKRTMWQPPAKTRGVCLQCDWTPVGTGSHNIGRECMRHTRKLGHVTRMAVVEVVEYRPMR